MRRSARYDPWCSSVLSGTRWFDRGSSREDATTNYFKTREPTSLLQRFLTVDEVANVATFLASDLSSGITGTAQFVEGGIVRHI